MYTHTHVHKHTHIFIHVLRNILTPAHWRQVPIPFQLGASSEFKIKNHQNSQIWLYHGIRTARTDPSRQGSMVAVCPAFSGAYGPKILKICRKNSENIPKPPRGEGIYNNFLWISFGFPVFLLSCPMECSYIYVLISIYTHNYGISSPAAGLLEVTSSVGQVTAGRIS